jgi:ATP-dependent Clp protease ATP-binding subunit ClpC
MHGYNFTERVRKVLAMAREEATRLHHEYVGTEHILLGLVREGEGVATAVLDNLYVDREALRRRVDEVVEPGKRGLVPGPDLPYTARAKKVLEHAMSEARELKHSYLGTEHLLLGALREGKGIAAQLLGEAGVTLDAARSEMLRILGGMTPPPLAQPNDEELRALKGKSVERVQVVLHYHDGRHFEGSFASVRDAVSFLRSAAGLSGG